jgi:hypothetical protein
VTEAWGKKKKPYIFYDCIYLRFSEKANLEMKSRTAELDVTARMTRGLQHGSCCPCLASSRPCVQAPVPHPHKKRMTTDTRWLFWVMGSILKLDCGDSCTTLQIYQKPLNCVYINVTYVYACIQILKHPHTQR